MSFLTPKVAVPPPPPALEPPSEADYAQATALSEDALARERRGRKGRKSTQVAGILGESTDSTITKPTLLG